jgi:ribosomal protein S8E
VEVKKLVQIYDIRGEKRKREERKDIEAPVATGLNKETKIMRIFNKLIHNTTRSGLTLTSCMTKSGVIRLNPRQYKYSVNRE